MTATPEAQAAAPAESLIAMLLRHVHLAPTPHHWIASDLREAATALQAVQARAEAAEKHSAHMESEGGRMQEERDKWRSLYHDAAFEQRAAEARALAAEAVADRLKGALACVKQQCDTSVYNISQRDHDEAVVRSFQSIADYCARTATVSGEGMG